jgi:hypothetical protein
MQRFLLITKTFQLMGTVLKHFGRQTRFFREKVSGFSRINQAATDVAFKTVEKTLKKESTPLQVLLEWSRSLRLHPLAGWWHDAWKRKKNITETQCS